MTRQKQLLLESLELINRKIHINEFVQFMFIVLDPDKKGDCRHEIVCDLWDLAADELINLDFGKGMVSLNTVI